jgi:hypothetical protein
MERPWNTTAFLLVPIVWGPSDGGHYSILSAWGSNEKGAFYDDSLGEISVRQNLAAIYRKVKDTLSWIPHIGQLLRVLRNEVEGTVVKSTRGWNLLLSSRLPVSKSFLW